MDGVGQHGPGLRGRVPMNGALISVRPRFAQDILSGVKTTELRRRAPVCKPGDVLIVYETSPTKAIVGFAIVSRVDDDCTKTLWHSARFSAGVSYAEYRSYFDGASRGVAIHLKEAKPLKRPIALNEARSPAPAFRPPQSWCYLRSLPAPLASWIKQVVRRAQNNA